MAKEKEVGFHKVRKQIHKPTKAHKDKKKYTRKAKHKKELMEKDMADVTYRDLEDSMKDIQRNMSVIQALLKRKNYGPEELRRINQALGGAATLVNKAIGMARKMGESTSTDLLDRIDNRIDELQEESDYQAFFKKKLKEYGVDSPDKLSDADKKKFFNEIEKEWKGEKN